MKLIGISGKRRAGKDTVAQFLTTRGYFVSAFATPLKDACRAVFGFTHSQVQTAGFPLTPAQEQEKSTVDPYWGVTPGWVLQVVGTECFREAFGRKWAAQTGRDPAEAADVWVLAKERFLCEARETDKIVITDVRFENEARMIRRLGGKLVRVERPGLPEPADGRSSTHVSETALDAWTDWDYRIVNDSTLDVLFTKVDAMVKELWP